MLRKIFFFFLIITQGLHFVCNRFKGVFFLPFPFGHWFPFTCNYMKDKIRLHLQMWWKILLLFNLDLLAASLPRDRHPSLCPTPLILLIFTTFFAQLFPHSGPCLAPVHAGMEEMAKRFVWTPFAWDFFFSQLSQNRPESQIPVCVCSWKHRAVAISPDVHSFSWGDNRKENPKNHQPLNFMHHNSCVCEHCIWYRAAPS